MQDVGTKLKARIDTGAGISSIDAKIGGVSNYDAGLLKRCERLRHVDSLQPPFSMIKRDAAGVEIPCCADHGTGVIVYSPMQSGLLTDSFDAGRVAQLPSDDWVVSSSRCLFEFVSFIAYSIVSGHAAATAMVRRTELLPLRQ